MIILVHINFDLYFLENKFYVFKVNKIIVIYIILVLSYNKV